MGEGRRHSRCGAPLFFFVQLFIFGLLLVNILQASIAIRSPPATHTHLSSPSKPFSPPPPSRTKQQQQQQQQPTPNWRGTSGGLSPHTTPQRQLAFSASMTGAGGGNASDPRGLAQSYSLTFNNSLLSTPPTSHPADFSFGSSTGSLPPHPTSSPLAAYRGRRAPTGRAYIFVLIVCQTRTLSFPFFLGGLDGLLLARLAQADSDSEVDE
ncbi:hypothetical protein B0F90DRAFT_1756894 [Multifurca ochricompacta]|uniref:Uncharacterized protein n=1 Tax=Multifurca ochricompacta TaxID=376703 RepID=A0AAD4LXX9_9AGAM|nr:hypothetical protein B0F90DRAFT_1756894 [Multifurca ochricompacta]